MTMIEPILTHLATLVVGVMVGGGVTWWRYEQVNEAVMEWHERIYE